eukprot:scaffold28488_cov18-Prasinocladus_malaysianus.AAC.1
MHCATSESCLTMREAIVQMQYSWSRNGNDGGIHVATEIIMGRRRNLLTVRVRVVATRTRSTTCGQTTLDNPSMPLQTTYRYDRRCQAFKSEFQRNSFVFHSQRYE